MPFVSVTRLRLRARRFLPAFALGAVRSARQAKSAQGALAVAVLADGGRAFWTLTVWDEEPSMRAFMAAGAHGRVMPRLRDWCDEAFVVHWARDSPEPPSWVEAHRRMMSEGRRSRVRVPSPAHERFEIPAPRAGRGELRLK